MHRHLQKEERHIEILDDFFFNAFDYLRANEIAGDYLEFGCGAQVISFRLAAKYRSMFYNRPRLWAFDSFRGLPQPTEDDIHPGWEKGSMAVSADEFRAIMATTGVKNEEYRIIEGFFDATLQGSSPATHGIESTAFAFIDCDYYSSTVPVLAFLSHAFAEGALLAFDDWHCYRSAPNKGQQRAFREFREVAVHLEFEPFLSWGWHGHSFIVRHSKARTELI